MFLVATGVPEVGNELPVLLERIPDMVMEFYELPRGKFLGS